jgi:acyl-[acyl-carrier protein] desaturase
VLELVMIDEAAHAQFFRQLVGIYLDADREATLEQFRMVANTFSMPADQLLADGRQRVANVKALKIFDEQVFFNEVFEPLLRQLGLTRADLRRRKIVSAA